MYVDQARISRLLPKYGCCAAAKSCSSVAVCAVCMSFNLPSRAMPTACFKASRPAAAFSAALTCIGSRSFFSICWNKCMIPKVYRTAERRVKPINFRQRPLRKFPVVAVWSIASTQNVAYRSLFVFLSMRTIALTLGVLRVSTGTLSHCLSPPLGYLSYAYYYRYFTYEVQVKYL